MVPIEAVVRLFSKVVERETGSWLCGRLSDEQLEKLKGFFSDSAVDSESAADPGPCRSVFGAFCSFEGGLVVADASLEEVVDVVLEEGVPLDRRPLRHPVSKVRASLLK